jgi:hypothetical protein
MELSKSVIDLVCDVPVLGLPSIFNNLVVIFLPKPHLFKFFAGNLSIVLPAQDMVREIQHDMAVVRLISKKVRI